MNRVLSATRLADGGSVLVADYFCVRPRLAARAGVGDRIGSDRIGRDGTRRPTSVRRRPARRPAPPRRALTSDLSSVPHVFVGAGRRSHGLGKRRAERLGREVPGRDPGQLEGALSFTLVPIRPRSRGERRFLRTSPGVSLRPPLAFDPRPRRLSTPLLTPFNSTPTSLRMDPRP